MTPADPVDCFPQCFKKRILFKTFDAVRRTGWVKNTAWFDIEREYAQDAD
jgi:hypothetical protein